MKRAPDVNSHLWPFGPGIALAAVPAIWATCAGAFFLMRTYLAWPGTESASALIYFSMAISVVPLLLLLLDFIAARGGVIGNKWLNVDFSKAIADAGIVSRESFPLPDNIFAEQDRLTDSGGSKLIEAMKRATVAEIVCIDIKDGSAWWVTRLLALCAGARGRGAPSAIVFVGRVENRERVFLGWSTPTELLTAILSSNDDYRARFQKAKMIARQLGMFGDWRYSLTPQIEPVPILPPAPPQSVALHPDVAINRIHYDESDAVMLAKISIEELRRTVGAPPPSDASVRNLEQPPDRLTLARLQELFAPCLYVSAVDRNWPNAQQLDRFLEATASYVAMVRNGIYEGMLRTDFGDRAILRELLRQSQGSAAKSAGSRQLF